VTFEITIRNFNQSIAAGDIVVGGFRLLEAIQSQQAATALKLQGFPASIAPLFRNLQTQRIQQRFVVFECPSW